MNAPLNAQIRPTRSFTAKILRNGATEDFKARFFTLELKDLPEAGGKHWVFFAEHSERLDEHTLTLKTIRLTFPENTESGTFVIPTSGKGLYIDYIDTSDADPYVHLVEKGSIILTLTRRGATQLGSIEGQLDVTVGAIDGETFTISGKINYTA